MRQALRRRAGVVGDEGGVDLLQPAALLRGRGQTRLVRGAVEQAEAVEHGGIKLLLDVGQAAMRSVTRAGWLAATSRQKGVSRRSET